MKFQIESYTILTTPNHTWIDKLLKKYPCLKDYGFEVEETVIKLPTQEKTTKIVTAYVHIHSLEELVELQNKIDHVMLLGHESLYIYDEFSIEDGIQSAINGG